MARCYLNLWWYLLNCLHMTIFKHLLNWKHAVKWEISLKGTTDTLKVWIKLSRSIGGQISKVYTPYWYYMNRLSWIHTQLKTYAVCFPKGLVKYSTDQPCVKAFSFPPVLQVCLLVPNLIGGGGGTDIVWNSALHAGKDQKRNFGYLPKIGLFPHQPPFWTTVGGGKHAPLSVVHLSRKKHPLRKFKFPDFFFFLVC